MYRIAEAGVCVMFGKLLKIWLALFLCLCFVIGGLVKYPELTEVLEPVGGILLLLLVAYSLFLVLLFMFGMVCAVIVGPTDQE